MDINLEGAQSMNTENYLGYLKLLLAINKPDYEECWINGYEHALHQTLDNNPFTTNTPEYRYWSEGWWTGFNTRACYNDEVVSDDLDPSTSQTFHTPTTYRLKKLQTSKVQAQFEQSNDSSIREKIFSNKV